LEFLKIFLKFEAGIVVKSSEQSPKLMTQREYGQDDEKIDDSEIIEEILNVNLNRNDETADQKSDANKNDDFEVVAVKSSRNKENRRRRPKRKDDGSPNCSLSFKYYANIIKMSLNFCWTSKPTARRNQPNQSKDDLVILQ